MQGRLRITTSSGFKRIPLAIRKWTWSVTSDCLEDGLQRNNISFRQQHPRLPEGFRLSLAEWPVMDDRLTLNVERKTKRCDRLRAPVPQGGFRYSFDDLRSLAHVVIAVAFVIDIGGRFHWRKLPMFRTECNGFRSLYLGRNPIENRA